MNGLGTNFRTLELRKDWRLQNIDPKGKPYTTVLVEVDAGERIILSRRRGDMWWSRVWRATVSLASSHNLDENF